MSQRLVRLVGSPGPRALVHRPDVQRSVTRPPGVWRSAPCRSPSSTRTVDELARRPSLANSAGSLAAYKDLYRVALNADLDRGLAYEASTGYAITDTDRRLLGFR